MSNRLHVTYNNEIYVLNKHIRNKVSIRKKVSPYTQIEVPVVDVHIGDARPYKTFASEAQLRFLEGIANTTGVTFNGTTMDDMQEYIFNYRTGSRK